MTPESDGVSAAMATKARMGRRRRRECLELMTSFNPLGGQLKAVSKHEEKACEFSLQRSAIAIDACSCMIVSWATQLLTAVVFSETQPLSQARYGRLAMRHLWSRRQPMRAGN